MVRVLILGIQALGLALSNVAVHGAIFHLVPGDSIHSAVEAATSGDEIVLASGTYFETLSLPPMGIILRSTNPQDEQTVAATVIDASRMGTVLTLVDGANEWPRIEGLTLKGGTGLTGGGIFIESASATFRNCRIVQNILENRNSMGGGAYFDSGGATFEKCEFVMNESKKEGGAIYGSQCELTIRGCRIQGNRGLRGSVVLEDSTFFLSHSQILAPQSGFYAPTSSGTVSNCTFEGNFSRGLTLGSGSVRDCFFSQNTSGVSLSQGTLEDCKVFNNNSTGISIGGPSLIRNVEVRENGSGIRFFSNSERIRVESCTIQGNKFTGISGSNAGGLMTIVDSDITGNRDYGLELGRNSSFILDRCRLTENRNGAYFYQVGSGTAINCVISDNILSGLDLIEDNIPKLFNCRIERNGGVGVFCRSNSWPEFYNCIIAGNLGAIDAADFSGPILFNSTVAANRAVAEAAIRGRNLSFPRIVNTILWNNGEEFALDESSEAILRHNCIRASTYSLFGNINSEPLFVDYEGGDFQLRNGSSCIDRGWTEETTEFDLEGRNRLEGDGLVDIGAFESPPDFLPGSKFHTPRTLYVRMNGPSKVSGLSWDDALSSVQSAINRSNFGDEIWVANGVYRERIDLIPGISVYGGFAGSETTLADRNLSSNRCVIDASGKNGVVAILSSRALLDGFVLTGGQSRTGGGVLSRNESTLRNCRVTRNRATSQGGGVWARNSTLINCLIDSNSAGFSGGAAHGESMDFINCTLVANRGDEGCGGVSSVGSSASRFFNCILWNPHAELESKVEPTVENCCIQGGHVGNGNIDQYPLFESPEEAEFGLMDGSPCIDRANPVHAPQLDYLGRDRVQSDGFPDIGALEAPSFTQPGPFESGGRVIRVDPLVSKSGDGSSWENSFSSITDALFLAVAGDSIWIKEGVYSGTTLCEPRVDIHGGFEGNERNLSERNWIKHPTIFAPVDPNGFSFQLCSNGGIYSGLVFGPGESGFGSGARGRNSDASFQDCIFAGAYRGIDVFSSTLRIERCFFTLCVRSVSTKEAVWISHSVFCGNAARSLSPSHLEVFAPSRIENCLFAGNLGGSGGGAGSGLVVKDDSTILHCTIAENTPGYGGGGIATGSSDVINCVLKNGGPEILGSRARVLFSLTEDNQPGSGNIQSDPEFVLSKDNTTARSKGQWTEDPVYLEDRNQTRFTDMNVKWLDGELENRTMTVNPNTLEQPLHCLIVENTTSTLTVWGDATQLAKANDQYRLYDFHLRFDSPAIDRGRNAFTAHPLSEIWLTGDLEGNLRSWDGDGDGVSSVDMGALEFGAPGQVGDTDLSGQLDGGDWLSLGIQWQQDNQNQPKTADLNGDDKVNGIDVLLLRTIRNSLQ